MKADSFWLSYEQYGFTLAEAAFWAATSGKKRFKNSGNDSTPPVTPKSYPNRRPPLAAIKDTKITYQVTLPLYSAARPPTFVTAKPPAIVAHGRTCDKKTSLRDYGKNSFDMCNAIELDLLHESYVIAAAHFHSRQSTAAMLCTALSGTKANQGDASK